jgi:hypothetical protein
MLAGVAGARVCRAGGAILGAGGRSSILGKEASVILGKEVLVILGKAVSVILGREGWVGVEDSG